jgi:hypothetical protein
MKEEIDNKFINHLEKTSEIVHSWPQWKQDVFKLIKNQVDTPSEVSKLIDEHFWELFEEEKEEK